MRGTYVLLVNISHPLGVTIGKLGSIDFKEGAYAYVGSALGGLEARVERHAREEKRMHWHVDYLLVRAPIVDVVYGESDERKECAVARRLAERFQNVRGFGASDCGCESHLFYSKNLEKLREGVIASFKSAGLEPVKGDEIG